MSNTYQRPNRSRLVKEQIERAYQQKAERERRDARVESNSRFDQLFIAFKQKERK